MNGVVVSSALVPITVSVGTFTALLPELSDIRKSKNDPVMCKDVRTAELTASALVLTVGLASAYLTKSMIPALAALASCAVLISMYEAILAVNPHPNQNGNANVYRIYS